MPKKLKPGQLIPPELAPGEPVPYVGEDGQLYMPLTGKYSNACFDALLRVGMPGQTKKARRKKSP